MKIVLIIFFIITAGCVGKNEIKSKNTASNTDSNTDSKIERKCKFTCRGDWCRNELIIKFYESCCFKLVMFGVGEDIIVSQKLEENTFLTNLGIIKLNDNFIKGPGRYSAMFHYDLILQDKGKKKYRMTNGFDEEIRYLVESKECKKIWDRYKNEISQKNKEARKNREVRYGKGKVENIFDSSFWVTIFVDDPNDPPAIKKVKNLSGKCEDLKENDEFQVLKSIKDTSSGRYILEIKNLRNKSTCQLYLKN